MYGTDKIGDIDDNEIDVMFSRSKETFILYSGDHR